MNWPALFMTIGVIVFTFLVFWLLARKDKTLINRIQADKELIVTIAPRYGFAILASLATLGIGIYLIIMGNGYFYEIYYLIVSILFLIVLVITVLILMLKYCTKGKLKIDEARMYWKIDSNEGEIIFDKPFTFQKYQAWRKIISPYSTAASAMVCEIQQDSKKLRFFVDAPADMIERFPETSELGIYCHIYGLEIVRRIEKNIKK